MNPRQIEVCRLTRVTWFQFLNAHHGNPCTKKSCNNYLAAERLLLTPRCIHIFSYPFSFSRFGISHNRTSQRPITEYLPIHNCKIETSQGVEFTAISCCKDGLGWSRCEGMTSRCKSLRSAVSFANEGRKFGSLENNTTERAISV